MDKNYNHWLCLLSGRGCCLGGRNIFFFSQSKRVLRGAQVSFTMGELTDTELKPPSDVCYEGGDTV